jgi:hypothetical protein
MAATGFEVTLARIQQLETTIAQLVRPATTAAGGFARALDRISETGKPTLEGPAERTAWARDLLAALGMPRTRENVRALVAWARAEGTAAAHNPLATTQAHPGATNFNSVGVKNYLSYHDGIEATVRTLTNGRYHAILDALRRGDDALAVARAIANSPWGTGDLVLRVLEQSPL